MMSIGVLGFVVWSWLLASPYGDIWNNINFAICLNGFIIISTLHGKNLIMLTQLAGNLFLYFHKNKIQSASETTRKTSFNFTLFRSHYIKLFGEYPSDLTPNFLTWFIGFVEGDGAIQTYYNNRRVRFVLTHKELSILYFIQNNLNIGVIKHFPYGKSGKNDFYRLIVDDASHILLLAFLFNGNLAISDTINQLSLWIIALNKRFGSDTILFIKHAVCITLRDGWISGFTDAEGCFSVSVAGYISYGYTFGRKIKMRFLLDHKNKAILIIIRDLFRSGKVTIRSGTKQVYRCTVTDFNSISRIISYFKEFPLYSKKLESLMKWAHVYVIVSHKLHFNSKGLEKINKLRKEININNSVTKKVGSKNP